MIERARYLSEGETIRILHVDDDACFLETAKPILEMQGAFQVETALSVEEAVEKMKKEEYDAVVSDYQMPGKDGLQFLKELRQKGNNIPFIIFTGKGREEVAIKALNLGADHYENKNGNPETVYSELSHDITNAVRTRRAEQGLRIQREELQVILDSMPAKIWYKDRDNRLVRVNKAFAEYMGVSKENLEGKSLCDVFPPDVAQKCWEEDKEVITTGQPKNDILDRYESAQGVRWFSTGKVPCRDKNGNIIGTINFSVDITENKKMEVRLKKSEKKYRHLVQNAHEGIWAIDKDAYTTFVNPRMAEILGYNMEEMKGRHLFSFMDERGVEIAKRLLERRKQGIKEQHEFEFLGKDGKRIYAIMETSPITDDNENYNGALASVMDITDRKKAEKALKESEAKYRTLANSLPEIVFEADTQGKLTFVNERAYAITGYLAEDFAKGLNALDFPIPEHRRRAQEKLKRAFSGEKTGTNEYTFQRKDGRPFPVLISTNPVVHEGKIVGARGIIMDISEQVRMEEELQHFSSAVKMSSEGVVITDLKGRIIEANDAATRFYSAISKDELVGKNTVELVDPRERHLVSERMKEATKKGFIHSHEYCINASSGSILFIELTTTALRDNKGKHYGFVSIIRDVTGRKKREEELKGSEQKFKSIFESATDVMVLIDAAGRILDVNQKAVEASGGSKMELVGKHFTQGILGTMSPTQLSKVEKGFAAGLANGKPSLDASIKNKKGQTILLECSASPFKLNDKSTGLLVVGRDITERKKAEKELARSEAKYRRLVEQSLEGIAVAIGPAPHLIFVNAALSRIWGYTPEELTTLSPQETSRLVHPEDQDIFFRCFRDRLEGKTPLSRYEFRGIKKDGTVIWLEQSATLIEYDGHPAVQATFIDVTERKKAEEVSGKERQELDLIINSSPIIVFYKDKEGKFLRANRAFAEVLQMSQEDFLGKTVFDLFPAEIAQSMTNDDSEVLESGCPKLGIIEQYESASGLRWVQTDKVPIFGENGFPNGIIGFAQDITERKKALERMSIVNEKLGVVGKLTRHDVRNKLSTVIGNTYLTKKTLPNDHMALTYLKKIELACEQTTRVLDFAAAYESLGAEGLTLMDVSKAVEEAVSLIAESKGVNVVNICQGLTVMADSALRQLFFNLIENSLEHGKNVSQIKIYYEEGKDRLKLFYEDNGVGIPKANKPKLFDWGFTTGKGSGHGLPLIKSMMEIYGWTIEEEGESGKGARFVMTIPNTQFTIRARNSAR